MNFHLMDSVGRCWLFGPPCSYIATAMITWRQVRATLWQHELRKLSPTTSMWSWRKRTNALPT